LRGRVLIKGKTQKGGDGRRSIKRDVEKGNKILGTSSAAVGAESESAKEGAKGETMKGQKDGRGAVSISSIRIPTFSGRILKENCNS